MENTNSKMRNFLTESSCFMDYYIHIITTLFRKTPKLNSNSILVIEIAGIGDTISATPAIRVLRKKYPDSRIDILVSKKTSSLLKNDSNLNNILTYNKNTLSQIKNQYTLAILLAPGSRKISTLLKNAGIPFRIGCTKRGATQGKGYYLTKKPKPLKGITHTINNNLNVLKTINMTTKNNTPELFTTKKEVEKFLKKYKIKPKDKIAVLSPGSKNIEKLKHPSHFWPYFAQLANNLNKKFKIIILVNKNEKKIAEEIKKSAKKSKPIILSNLSLREIMALMKRADLVIAVDSGPMHIAEAFNTPLIALFGPQNPKRWKPLSKNSRYLYNNKVCTGCQRYFCKRKDTICMTSITVKDVLKKIKEIKR